jgi:heat shock protein HslJ
MMTQEQSRSARRGPSSPEIQVLVSMFAAAVLMTAVAVLAIAILGAGPPRLALTGTTWQWTGSATDAGAAPLVVPDPAAYTVRFGRDGTFEAVADCARVSGTYSTVPAGRAGGGTNSLTLVQAPASPAACGAGSLAGPFLQQLESASRYTIAGSQLTITLAPRGTMTFEAAVPAASSTPGD